MDTLGAPHRAGCRRFPASSGPPRTVPPISGKRAAIAATVRAWRCVSVPVRVHQAVVLAGLLALLWFCRHWNLLGRHL
ncbi:hypothetical protein GCM10009677_62010 [Sphaerisporangium rubeum]